MASQPPGWFLKSPVEVIVIIASYLPTIDYCALRRTCKHVEAALFHAFANEFFRRRQFMLTEFSLQALIDISQSRLGSSVEYVSLSTDKPRLDQFRNNSFRYHRLDSYEQALQQNRFHEEYENHCALVTSGRDYEMLLQGLRKLPNLQTLSLRDFQSNGRYRDGRDARWRPYGSTTFFLRTSVPTESETRLYRYQAATGGPMHMSSPIEEAELLYLKHLLMTLLRLVGALATDGTVKGFEVILRKLALGDSAFAMALPVRAAVLPGIESLKSLFLDLCTMAPATMVEDSEGNIKSSYNYHLLQILASARSVEHFRINCKDPQSKIGVDELFTWFVGQPDEDAVRTPSLRKYSALPQIPPCVGFPKLERIEIGFAFLEADTLLGLFRKFETSLRAINLHKINLAATRDQQTDKVNLWARLLNGMAALNLNLTSIVLEEVGQGSEPYRCLPLKFNNDARHNRKMTWSGQATLHGLKDIHTALHIDWPEEDSMHPNAFTDNEDEDELEDMDGMDEGEDDEGNDEDGSEDSGDDDA